MKKDYYYLVSYGKDLKYFLTTSYDENKYDSYKKACEKAKENLKSGGFGKEAFAHIDKVSNNENNPDKYNSTTYYIYKNGKITRRK